MTRTFRTGSLVTAAAMAVSVALAPPVVAQEPADGITVLATGLVSPLHVSPAAGHRLTVADGFSGRILELDLRRGTQEVVAQQQGLVADAVGRGLRYATVACEPNEGCPFEESAEVVRVTPSGRVLPFFDALAFELANNPDGQPFTDDATSNPYALLERRGRVLVVDAAANALLSVRHNGRAEVLTVFPVDRTGDCADVPNNGVPDGGCDPVPTDIAEAPDGTLWLSGLGAFVDGKVWQVDPDTGAILQTFSGLPPLTGIAVDEAGTVYVSSALAGVVLRLGPDGTPTGALGLPGATDVDALDGRLVVATADLEGEGPGQVLAVEPRLFDAP